MTAHQQRFARVLDYIDAHLEEPLTVELLSEVAHLSKYHFHRQFSAYLGISLASYIKQLRMKQASYNLAFRTDTRIIDMAIQQGYQSSEAFSRSFKQHFGQSPSHFRTSPQWADWHQELQALTQLRSKPMQDIHVDIVNRDAIAIAVMEHRGAPHLLGHTLQQFIGWRRANKLHPARSRTFNLVYDDPAITAAEDYRFDLCAEVTSAVADHDGVLNKEIPAGRYAVVRHTGSDDQLAGVVHYLYGQWLSHSGERLRDFPLIFERVSLFPEVAEHQAITDIWLPIED